MSLKDALGRTLKIDIFMKFWFENWLLFMKAGLKLDAFYNILIRESLLDGAVATSTNDNNKTVTKAQFMGIEDTKLVFEVAQSFNNSSSYFFSYLIRTLSEFTIASLLLAWLIIEGLPTIEVIKSVLKNCKKIVHSTVY